MSSKIQVKRGTTAQWSNSSTNDITLAPGQPGIEYKTNGTTRVKFGDQSTKDWSDISYTVPDIGVYRDNGNIIVGSQQISVGGVGGIETTTICPHDSSSSTIGTLDYSWSSLYLQKNTSSVNTKGIYFSDFSTPAIYVDESATLNFIRNGGFYFSNSTGYPNIRLNSSVAQVSIKNDSTMFGFVTYTFGTNSFSTAVSNNASLGSSSSKWTAVYATEGTIQTSDRAEKSDITYIERQPMLRARSTLSSQPIQQNKITTDTVLNFIKNIDPVTFVYKENNEDQTIENAIESNKTESIQLGLIADDIKDDALFNYIGATMKTKKVIKEAEYNDAGEQISEPVYEEETTLGLKPLPMTVAALTACKYLLNEVESLKQQLNQ